MLPASTSDTETTEIQMSQLLGEGPRHPASLRGSRTGSRTGSQKAQHKGWILATVCAAVLAINLDTTIVNVALPSISRELSAGTRQLQWVVDGYNLAFAGLVLAAGSLSDRFGRRPALIVGLVGFAAASAVGAMVTDAGALVAARFAMGTFAALIFPTTLSI